MNTKSTHQNLPFSEIGVNTYSAEMQTFHSYCRSYWPCTSAFRCTKVGQGHKLVLAGCFGGEATNTVWLVQNNTILQPLPDALLDLNRLNEKMRKHLITSCLLVFLEIQIWATRSYALSLSDNEDGIEEDCSLSSLF